jgi:YggT family protein
MFIIANFLSALGYLVSGLLTFYWWIVVVRAVLSFVNPDPYNKIVMALERLTEPVFYAVRKQFPFVFQAGIDFSPLIILLAIKFLNVFLVNTIFDIASRLR